MRAMICLVVLLAGCTAEGNSIYLSHGPIRYFTSMDVCRAEAVSEYPKGGGRYTAFECRPMFLFFFQIAESEYIK